MDHAIVIRRSTGADRHALDQLAALDSRRPPAGEALLAFVGQELRAALPLDGGPAIGDPFRPTAELIELLRAHWAAERPASRRSLLVLRPRTA